MKHFHNNVVRTTLFAALFLVASAPAFAATRIYMTIEGASQGKFKGEMVRAGVAPEELPVLSVTHETSMATGQMSGKRQHGTISIVREVDSSSPKLFRASTAGEPLREVAIHFIGSQSSGAGAGKIVETIVLNDAVITSIQKVGTRETIKIDYQTINVTYVGGKKAASDDWHVQ